jgi:decaprenylphospho-beta-D-ribofuranose 2-oxidase
VPREHQARPLQPRPRRSRRVPFMMPSFVLNALTVKAFNRRFYRKHTAGRRTVDYDTFFYPLDSVLDYDRMYGRRGFVQYQAVLPRSSSREALAKMLHTLSASRSASFLAVLKTLGEESEGLLSFPRAGHTLALDLPNTGQRLRTVLADLDRIVLDHCGRIYLAKDAFLTPEALRAMYPRLDAFLQVKRRIDPDNRITSSLARRVGIV